MDPKIQQELVNKLSVLADKLGVEASYLFNAYVKQCYINGFEDIVICLCCIVFAVFVYTKYINVDKDEYERYSSGEKLFFTWVLVVGLAVSGLFFATQGVDNLFNPKLQAFKALVYDIRK
ncbi:MAG: hypothetical protein ACRYGG_15645 [Janthinobacterium lividum]